jgi:hypothetical protein
MKDQQMPAMKMLAKALPLLGAGLAATSFISYRSAVASAEAAWRDIASRAQGQEGRFTPAMIADLPPVARRYFNRAIAPGTPLRTTVELEMGGTFLLGDKHRYQTYVSDDRKMRDVGPDIEPVR